VTEHEYTILGGFSRAKVGRILGSISAGLASVLSFAVLTLIDVAKRFGIAANVPPIVFSLIGAASIWAVIYLLFNKYVWRLRWVSRALKAPDVSGSYVVSGETLNGSGAIQHVWNGSLTISQSWDRIRVRLKTGTSTSYSITASLYFDPTDGYRLLYHYRNEAVAGAQQLGSHRGFADILFDDGLEAGAGEYFNGQGRFTFGRMSISRVY
jgi:uncharacterized membrane protein YuzA (DUF378 family)